jgi:hypothetical protein
MNCLLGWEEPNRDRLWVTHQRMELIEARGQCCVRVSSGDFTNVCVKGPVFECLPSTRKPKGNNNHQQM